MSKTTPNPHPQAFTKIEEKIRKMNTHIRNITYMCTCIILIVKNKARKGRSIEFRRSFYTFRLD